MNGAVVGRDVLEEVAEIQRLIEEALRGGAGAPIKYESEERGAEQLLAFANGALGASYAMRA